MDSAATSLVPEPVIAAMNEYDRQYRASVGRGMHGLARVATQRYQDAYDKVSNFIGGKKGTLVSDLHTRTGGIHIVGLFGQEGRICIMEDIGRHNALDKAIGYGLKHEVDFSRTIVASSEGEALLGNDKKMSYSQYSYYCIQRPTTTLAIRLGEQSGLTILGFVRGQKMNIYTGTERIRNKDSV